MNKLMAADKVKEALNLAKTQGISSIIARVKGRLDMVNPLGYSCAGVVINIGQNIKDIKIGDMVACAGVGYANHAKIVWVPQNLVVKVLRYFDFEEAASVTLDAIAMQKLGRAKGLMLCE